MFGCLASRFEDLNRGGACKKIIRDLACTVRLTAGFTMGEKNSKAAYVSVEVWENGSHTSACL